jgi:seryl-tRNA(Sec) selenium transferase
MLETIAPIDLVCFSGDKLLDGPQAGIIAGSRRLVDSIQYNPLMRTYSVDKLIYGALEATIGSYRFSRAACRLRKYRCPTAISFRIRPAIQLLFIALHRLPDVEVSQVRSGA